MKFTRSDPNPLGYPFYLCLAVPKSFTHEIVANQNLTNFKFKLDSILADNTPQNTGQWTIGLKSVSTLVLRFC